MLDKTNKMSMRSGKNLRRVMSRSDMGRSSNIDEERQVQMDLDKIHER
jgi:hypothetical protein